MNKLPWGPGFEFFNWLIQANCSAIQDNKKVFQAYHLKVLFWLTECLYYTAPENDNSSSDSEWHDMCQANPVVSILSYCSTKQIADHLLTSSSWHTVLIFYYCVSWVFALPQENLVYHFCKTADFLTNSAFSFPSSRANWKQTTVNLSAIQANLTLTKFWLSHILASKRPELPNNCLGWIALKPN